MGLAALLKTKEHGWNAHTHGKRQKKRMKFSHGTQHGERPRKDRLNESKRKEAERQEEMGQSSVCAGEIMEKSDRLHFSSLIC